MGRSVRAAVIGAGVAGLRTACELQLQGHRVVIFEKSDKLGGLWVYDPRVDSDPLSIDPTRETVHSSLYRSMRTNLPTQLMSFLDYPFPKRENGDPRTFPAHEEVLWFLNKFADDFGLVELVRFSTEVVRVARVDERNNEWLVESRSSQGSDHSVSQEVFEAVVVCTGHFSEPELAVIPGIEKWPGYKLHSHNYRVPEIFRGQACENIFSTIFMIILTMNVVVIIGLGASAFDISRDVATEAKEVHIATRNPDVQVRKLESHNNIWMHKMIKQAYDDGTIAFQDGSLIYADTIIYCTGYKYNYPFLETNGIVTVEENRVGPLFEHVFPPHLAPWLSFIGIPAKDAAIQVIDIQTKWVAGVLSGKVMLPNEEEMMASTKELYRKMEENGLPKCYTHVIKSNGVAYKNWLLAQIGLPPLEEWKVKVYNETAKNIRGMQDGYRDRLDDAFWEAFLNESQLPVNGDDAKNQP